MGLALALGTDHARLWAYQPSERVRYEGRATPQNLRRLLGAPLALADVVDILLGVPPSRWRRGHLSGAVTPEGHRLTLPLANGEQHLVRAGHAGRGPCRGERRDGTIPTHRSATTRGFPHVVDDGVAETRRARPAAVRRRRAEPRGGRVAVRTAARRTRPAARAAGAPGSG
jgi:hypothetical protein